MPLGQCMRRDDARGSAVCAGRAYARQGIMASTVFFSALGWAGDLGAFFRARSSLAPSSCSCLRPRPARTWGNQSCSYSSMWCVTFSISTETLASKRSAPAGIAASSMHKTSAM